MIRGTYRQVPVKFVGGVLAATYGCATGHFSVIT